MAFYPRVTEETVLSLTPILQYMERDPSYLSSPDCPYSERVKDFFRKFQKPEKIDIFAGKDELPAIDEQIIDLLNDLETTAAQLGTADHQEKMNYFKLKTTLLEKLISMRERVVDLKQIHEFKTTILAFLEEECSKDQISNLMKRLDGVLGINQ